MFRRIVNLFFSRENTPHEAPRGPRPFAHQKKYCFLGVIGALPADTGHGPLRVVVLHPRANDGTRVVSVVAETFLVAPFRRRGPDSHEKKRATTSLYVHHPL